MPAWQGTQREFKEVYYFLAKAENKVFQNS